MNGVIGQRYFAERVQCISRRGYVVLRQRATQPVIGNTRQGSRICGSNGLNCLMQRPGIRFPMKLDGRKRYFRVHIGWFDGQRSIQDGNFVRILP